MKLKTMLIVVALSCGYTFFSSCTKTANVDHAISNSAETSSKISSLNPTSSPQISQDPQEIFRRTKLTNTDIDLIQSKFGQVDINSFHSRVYSTAITTYSTTIRSKPNMESVISKILITDEFINNKHILTAYVSSVESFDKGIDASLNTSQIINGKITLSNLNNGISIESTILAGVDKGVKIRNKTIKLGNSNLVESYSTCFANCVMSFWESLSWLERAICIIDIELCLPGTTIGCSLNCT